MNNRYPYEDKLENALRYLGDNWLIAKPINPLPLSWASIRDRRELQEIPTYIAGGRIE